MNLNKADAAATQLLRKHKIKKAPVPVEAIATAEGLHLKYHDLEENVSGLLIDQAPTLVIAINSMHHPNRQRFTIAHELAHYSLHRGDPTVFVDKSLVHFRSDPGPSDRFDRREAEANHFAACLLMPEALLKADLRSRSIDLLDDLPIRKLATKYQVSIQALSIRLERLGLISR